MRNALAIALVAGTAVAASGQINLELTRQAVIDFSGEFEGTNIGSVAYDGSNIFVGGFNNGGTAGSVNISKFDGSTYSQFGSQSITAFRGIGGMDISNGQLGVSYNLDGGASADRVQTFDINGNLLQTGNDLNGAMTTRGDSGVAFDSTNGGLAFASFGSGRFRQMDLSTGSAIEAAGGSAWNNATGPFNFDSDWGTAYRDVDIDDNGNIYAREGLQVIKYERNAPNGFETPLSAPGRGNLTPEFGDADGDNASPLLKLSAADPFGVVFYNDPALTPNGGPASGQLLENVIKAVGMNGETVNLTFNGGSFFQSNGLFDLHFDASTNTLAVAEFSSNRVYLYSVVPAPGAAGLLAVAGLAASRRRRA